MKKLVLILLVAFMALFCFTSCDIDFLDEDTQEKDQTKWNIMIYLCGSTLEEGGGYGSYNLNEIAQTKPNSDVDLYIMTGGVRSEVDGNSAGWMNKRTDDHGNNVYCDAVYNMDLSRSVDGGYQYWKYVTDSTNSNGYGKFQEITTTRGMDDGDTLTSFITLCTGFSPYRKNALVLWDHGGGLLGGLISDYSDDTPDKTVMSFNELGKAISDCGQDFDAIITDLCVMQSLETALTLCDHASYLVGSQNSITAYGMGYTKWLQYAYDNPKCSGLSLGKKICDSHMQKYAAPESLDPYCTCSVIDLSQVKSLATSFDSIYKKAATYINVPSEMQKFVSVILNSQDFDNRMYDIADASSLLFENGYITEQEYCEITEKLENAVAYNRTGTYRPKASGLSFMFFLGNGLETDDEVFKYINNYTTETMPSFYSLMHTRYAESNKAKYSLELSVTDGQLCIPYSQRYLVSTVGVQHVLQPKDTTKPTVYYSYYILNKNGFSSDLSTAKYSPMDGGLSVMALKGKKFNNEVFYQPIPMYQIMTRRDSEGLYTKMSVPFVTGTNASGIITIIYDFNTDEYSAYLTQSGYSNDNTRKACLTDISGLGQNPIAVYSACSNGSAVCTNIEGQWLFLNNDNSFEFDKMPLEKDSICGTEYELGYRYIVYDTYGVANVSEVTII